jgi:hypothetical protein
MCLLATVGALSSVRHAHKALFIDLPPTQVLVGEHFTIVDTHPASSIAIGDIAALDHEF